MWKLGVHGMWESIWRVWLVQYGLVWCPDGIWSACWSSVTVGWAKGWREEKHQVRPIVGGHRLRELDCSQFCAKQRSNATPWTRASGAGRRNGQRAIASMPDIQYQLRRIEMQNHRSIVVNESPVAVRSRCVRWYW